MGKFVVSLIALALFTGCGDNTPTGNDLEVAMTATSPVHIVSTKGAQIVDLPSVTVSWAATSEPAERYSVKFTITAPDSTSVTQTVRSNAQGIARLASWRLGTTPGQYVVIATAVNGNTVEFRAYVPGTIAEIYDRVTGSTVDRNASLVLLDDGSWFSSTDVSGFPAGTYLRRPTDYIQFFLDPINIRRTTLAGYEFMFGTAQLDGDRMHVATTRSDPDTGGPYTIVTEYLRRR